MSIHVDSYEEQVRLARLYRGRSEAATSRYAEVGNAIDAMMHAKAALALIALTSRLLTDMGMSTPDTYKRLMAAEDEMTSLIASCRSRIPVPS